MKERERERAEVQYQATREHYRRLRQFKLQQIQTIQLLPSCKRIRHCFLGNRIICLFS